MKEGLVAKRDDHAHTIDIATKGIEKLNADIAEGQVQLQRAFKSLNFIQKESSGQSQRRQAAMKELPSSTTVKPAEFEQVKEILPNRITAPTNAKKDEIALTN